MGRRLERTETHLAWTPNIDNRRDADGVVDPEVLELAGLEVDVRGVVLVRDRPGVARAPRVAGVGRGRGVVRAAVFVREGLDTCKTGVGVWSRRGCE